LTCYKKLDKNSVKNLLKSKAIETRLFGYYLKFLFETLCVFSL